MKRAPIMLGLEEGAWNLWDVLPLPSLRPYYMYEAMAWWAVRVTRHR